MQVKLLAVSQICHNLLVYQELHMAERKVIQGRVWPTVAERWEVDILAAADAGFEKGDVLTAALQLWLALTPEQKVEAIQSVRADMANRLKQAFAEGQPDEEPTEADRTAAKALLDAAQARQRAQSETKSRKRRVR